MQPGAKLGKQPRGPWKQQIKQHASPDRKPFQVKDSSEVEASTTPPMMGTSVRATGRLGLSPRNMADRSTAGGWEKEEMVSQCATATLGSSPGSMDNRSASALLARWQSSPPNINTSDTQQGHEAAVNACKRSSPENMGSSALMVWVKDTATDPRLMLVSRLPSVCTAASGETDVACGGRNSSAAHVSVDALWGGQRAHGSGGRGGCSPKR